MSANRLIERIRAEVNHRSRLGFVRYMMRRVGRYYRYYRLCGPVRAARCALAEFKGESGLVPVDDPSLGGTFWLRLGSTDISVAGKILLEREYELPLSREPEIIVDAGAYTGISSLWFAARYPDATVVALEPDASNFALLSMNVSGVEKIIPLRAALWNDDGLVSVIEAGNGAWGHRVAIYGAPDSVQATSVPTLMRRFELDRIDLLKLDIEGSEVELFAGNAERWLSSVDAIAVETHEEFRAGARRVVLRACADFSATDVGHETLFLERARTCWFPSGAGNHPG